METVLFSEESLQDAVLASFDPVLYKAEKNQDNTIFVAKAASPGVPFLNVVVKYLPGGSVIYLDYNPLESNNFLLTRKLNNVDKKLCAHRRHKEYKIQYNDVSQLIACWNAKVDELCEDIKKMQSALEERLTYSKILSDELILTKDFVKRYGTDKREDLSSLARTIDIDYSTFTGKSDWSPEDVIEIVKSDPLFYMDGNVGLSTRYCGYPIDALINEFAKECISA